MITEIIMPKLDRAMEEGTIGQWLKKEGEWVEKGEPILKIEVEKATFELEAKRRGFLRKILFPEGETVSVNKVIAYISDSPEEEISGEERPTVAEMKETAPPVATRKAAVRIKASPLAKKLAEERGIDLSKVKGTGPGGRILAKDVAAFKEEKKEEVTGVKIVPLSRIRKITAERMVESKKNIPHFYVEADIDVTELVKLRQSLIPEIKKINGARLAYDDLIIKATSSALKELPIINSTFEDDKIKSFSDINICIAITLEDGLVVPVIRKVDEKRISEISKEREELVKKARGAELGPQDIYGGTFTVSNVGMFGVDGLAAIINPPQAALLSVGMIKEAPAVRDGKVEIRKIMRAILSVDHRVADGATGSKFLKMIKDNLENPYLLLKDGI